MKQILWFRRDLRINDNAILANAKDEVLPIFIFDKNILKDLSKDDKRVNFIYNSVLKLKNSLKNIGLDLAIFYDEPINVFNSLKNQFDEVLCSIDFDFYSKKRDKEIEKIIPMKRFIDSFILNPWEHLKSDGYAYRVFTPFYKSMNLITSSNKIEEFDYNKNLKKSNFSYDNFLSLEQMNFEKQALPDFLNNSLENLLKNFEKKLENYQESRDFFHLDGTSNLSVHLRFGLISPKQLFNYFKRFSKSEFFIRELFWREFYNYILYHYPNSQFENLNGLNISWSNNTSNYQKWCNGETGVPIIDAAMKYLNKTGTMHNRLRMIVASFLTKNLFIDWKWGEKYFASKLLDYELSSNVGSWQWAASTGADASPYFRVFNPYTQSKKFDNDAIFIKSVLKQLEHLPSKLFHIENAISSNLFVNYPKAIVDIKISRAEAIKKFKEASNAKI